MDTPVTTSQNTPILDDRRRLPRQKFITPAMLYWDNPKEGPHWVTLKDISSLGLGFEADFAIETGSRRRLRVEAGPNCLNWRVRVVCCGKIDHQLYRIGCEFVPAAHDLFDLNDQDLGLGQSDEVLILQ